MGSCRRENKGMRYWTVWLQACWLHCFPPSIWPRERNSAGVTDCDWTVEMADTLFLHFYQLVYMLFMLSVMRANSFSMICLTCMPHCICVLCLGCLLVALKSALLPFLLWPLRPVCLPAANQPLWAELEVLLPAIGMGQLRHSVRGWTAAHQENLLGSVWFSVTEGKTAESLFFFLF